MSEYLIKEDVDNILKEYASKAWNDDWKPTHETVRGDTFIEACLIIDDMPTADVQPIVYAHKTINVGRRSYCSNCRKLAIMEDFCSKCGAKVKDGE